MKVLLLNPFLTVYPDDPASANPMLSLVYLGAYLLRAGFEVKILDIAAEGVYEVRMLGKKLRYGLGIREIKKRLKEYSPQIVGITCQSTLHAKDAYETAKIIKEADPKILVVMGGAHSSSAPHEVLQDRNVDIVVKGEGEVTFLEIVKNFEKGGNLDNILGTFIRKAGKIIENSPRPFIKSIDSLPFPARHLLPMDIYFHEIATRTNYMMRDRAMTMITSRGCPGQCIYCAVRTIWGRLWRARSPKNVVDEIESLMKDYGVNEIHFIDDSISVNMKRLKEICDEIIKRRLNIKWTVPNGIAVWLLDKDLLRKMKKAGCYRLTFGLESGNYELLHNFVAKHYDYGKARKIIKFASRIGLWTIGTFIIGFPYEERKSIEDTIDFATSTDLDFAIFYIANPFPGTPMYDIYLKEGLLPKTGALTVVRGCKTKYFTHEELKKLQGEAFSRFLRSRLKKPWLFVNKIRSIEDFTYVLKLGRNFSQFILNPTSIKRKGIAALWDGSNKRK